MGIPPRLHPQAFLESIYGEGTKRTYDVPDNADAVC